MFAFRAFSMLHSLLLIRSCTCDVLLQLMVIRLRGSYVSMLVFPCLLWCVYLESQHHRLTVCVSVCVFVYCNFFQFRSSSLCWSNILISKLVAVSHIPKKTPFQNMKSPFLLKCPLLSHLQCLLLFSQLVSPCFPGNVFRDMYRALAQLEEMNFSTVRMHMHKHRHRALTSLWLFVEDSL